jgi:hypothetical protein
MDLMVSLQEGELQKFVIQRSNFPLLDPPIKYKNNAQIM